MSPLAYPGGNVKNKVLWSDPDNAALQKQVQRLNSLGRWSNRIAGIANTHEGPWWLPVIVVAAAIMAVFIPMPRQIAFVMIVVIMVALVLVVLIGQVVTFLARLQYNRIANGTYGLAMGFHSFEWDMLNTQLEREGAQLEAVAKPGGAYSKELRKYVTAIAQDLEVIRGNGFSDSAYRAAHDGIEQRAYETAEAVMTAARSH